MSEKPQVQVDELDMLRQMVQNFNKPLELIREAISNSYDAGANNIEIVVKRQLWEGNQRWIVKIRDDGAGMVRDETLPKPNEYTGILEEFFKLGGSSRVRDKQVGYQPVGEKCLGIKLSFHSDFLRVKTWAGTGFPVWVAECYQPWASIFKGEFPNIGYKEDTGKTPEHTFTEIEVIGFYDNDGSHFQADEIEDYIRWFTKWGSFENRIKEDLKNQGELLKLHTGMLRAAPTGQIKLEAPGATTPRVIQFGHPFPDCGNNPVTPNQRLEAVISESTKLPYDQMLQILDKAKRNHWRYIVKTGTLRELPDVCWEAIISVEGEDAKRSYNPYLRQRQRSDRFSYKAESRYGLWFCKDFFCIEQRNPVAMEVLEKEGQRTRFQILVNCQSFLLNNDRNSVGGSDARLLRGMEDVAKDLVNEMVEDESWTWTKIIEEETEVRTSEKQDKLQLQQRAVQALKKPQLVIGDDIIFPQPASEAETVLLLECLRNKFNTEFSFFEPLDWRTDNGIDCVVKSEGPGENCRFAEFKKDLGSGQFNHTFAWLHYIVCWQVKAQEGSILIDPAKKKRTLRRHKADEYDLPHTAPWTLEGEQQTIKVYALKDILIEKHGVQFVSTDKANAPST
jgi:hypothetical protein